MHCTDTHAQYKSPWSQWTQTRRKEREAGIENKEQGAGRNLSVGTSSPLTDGVD